MSIGNPALGEALAQHGSPHRLLAALAEGGILVAVRPDRSVVLGTTQAGDRVLLGYTSPVTYARHRGSHRLSECDAQTIIDIQRVTGVREIVIDAAGPAAAAIPIADLQRYLEVNPPAPSPAMAARSGTSVPHAYATGAMATVPRTPAYQDTAPPAPQAAPPAPPPREVPGPPPAQPARPWPAPPPASPSPAAAQAWIPAPRPHLSGPMQQVDPGYKRTNHPILPALRVAVAELLCDFPLVHHVWISGARTISGADGIMLHVKVHSDVAEDIVKDLHRLVRARLPQLAASGAPVLMARVADANTERRMIELGAHVVCAGVAE
jgi:Predicted membrane protein